MISVSVFPSLPSPVYPTRMVVVPMELCRLFVVVLFPASVFIRVDDIPVS